MRSNASMIGLERTEYLLADRLTDEDLKEIVASSGIEELRKAYADEHDGIDGIDDGGIDNEPDDERDVRLDSSKTAEERSRAHASLAVRMFLKRNAEMLYILLALFIFTEGIALTKLPRWWWVPVVGDLAVLALIIAWRSSKSILKALFSFCVLVFATAFQMLFATAYTGLPNVGVLVPATMVCAYFIFISISYMIDTNVSRWGAGGMGVLAGFIASYGLIAGGIIPSCIGAGAGMILGGIIWMHARNLWQRRSYNMPLRPRTLDGSKTKLLRDSLKNDYDVLEYTKGRYPFWMLLPKNGGKDKIAVIQPLGFQTHLVDSAKRGLTYRHRRIGEYFYKVASYCRSRTDSNAVIMFADCSGTLKIHDIIGIEMADSNDPYHVGLVDISNRQRTVRNDIIETMNRFVYPVANERTIRRLRSYANNDDMRDEKTRKDEA